MLVWPKHKRQPDLRKTRLCPSLQSKAGCALRAEECRFAHSQAELRLSYDKYYKVQACAFFAQGKCRNGSFCRFAHGAAELRGAKDSCSDEEEDFAPAPKDNNTDDRTDWSTVDSPPRSRLSSSLSEQHWLTSFCSALSSDQIREGLVLSVVTDVYED